MAIYHCSVSNVSRGAGSSSVASLSYITAQPQRDEYWHQTYNGFGRRERVIETGTLLPEGAPAEWRDAGKLFNGIEMAEKSVDARTAKKIVVALPVELTAAQRREAVETYIREQLTARGYAATYAIHEDAEGRNPHAHILVPNRQIDQQTGTWAKVKQKSEYVRDPRTGERVPLIDPETGKQKTDSRNRKQWKRRTVKANPLDRRETLESLRSGWAEVCNRLLPEGAQIDHRSHEARGIDLEPTIHEGYAAREIEKRGGVADRCEMNREIRQRNTLIEAMRRRMAAISEQIHALTGQIARLLEAIRQRRTQPMPDPWTTEKPVIPPIPAETPRVQAKADPRAYIPAARQRLEEARNRTVAGYRADLRAAQTAADQRLARLKANPGEDWRRILPSLNRVENALDHMDSAGILTRGKARRELEAIATAETATIRQQVPWLTIGPVPAARADYEAWRDTLRAQIEAREMAPYEAEITRCRNLVAAADRPITASQITTLAEHMASENTRNAPQTREQRPRHPEPQGDAFGAYSPSQEAHRGNPAQEHEEDKPITKTDVLARLHRRATERMDDQAQQEAEQQLDPFDWTLGLGLDGPTHHGFTR